MNFTLEEKIRTIFNANNLVKIEKVLRTKNGEKHYKYTWSIEEIQFPEIHTINWWGFDTLDECVEDCLTYLAIKGHTEKIN